ncbi:TerC/Alx family metal homeostasis membrane protein [uncultured Mycobacterium sp.]|uniref:TerC/Alx family metal homeostasis membrane protein n=1 Tax=uncultured Mycobacterium sp. TaxID=171292 RepID=UPI0035CA3172
MGVSGPVWALTIAIIVGLALFDYFFHVRRPHIPTVRDAAIWSTAYIEAAIVFGGAIVMLRGTTMGIEYFACYLSNEALSVDNLFVFLVIMASFGVPRVAQQKVLLFGIVFALIARTGFIVLGAALVRTFDWAFYLFAVLLLVTSVLLAKPEASEHRSADTFAIRVAKRFLRTSDNYDRDRLFIVENGRRVMTPMLLVMTALGGTDLLFAFDSVPALFGLTRNVYLIFAATSLSLLGLRQLYFLIDGLLYRLVYLSYGLALILAFIGVKLMLQALRENNVPFVNGGKSVPVVELSTTVSLTVIIAILVITTVLSLLSARGRAQNAVARARRHAIEYLDPRYESDPVERQKIFDRLLDEESQIRALPSKYREQVSNDGDLMQLLRQAHEAHDAHNAR